MLHPEQPRASPRARDPTPRPPRAARAAGRRARGSAGWGRGRRAHPSPPLQTRAHPHAPLGSGRWRTVPSSGPREEKRDKILRDSCSPRNRGGLAPYPFYMLRRLPPVRLRTGTPPGNPRGRQAAGWKPRRALAEAPGRRGRPLLARAAVRATRERTTPRAAAALRRPLPAQRSTTGRGDPRLQQGEPRGALRLASRPSPGAAPDGS